MVLEWNPEGRRKKGKRWVQWMDEIRRGMISKDFTEEETDDRELCHFVCQHVDRKGLVGIKFDKKFEMNTAYYKSFKTKK